MLTRIVLHSLALWLVATPCSAASITVEEVATAGVTLPWISVSGEINTLDVPTFERMALDSGGQGIVLLESPGGDLQAGIEIGRLIRAQGLSTAVKGVCASACALAWLAGRVKLLGQNGRIGFHAAYVDGPVPRESGVGNAIVGLYLGELGLGQNVVRYVTTAPPGGMRWLTFRDAELLGIDVTAVAENDDIDDRETDEPAASHLPSAGQSPPGLDAANILRAVKNAEARFKKAGIQGLAASSDACWKVVQQKKTLDAVQYCYALDLFGSMLNEIAIEKFGHKAAIRHFASEARTRDFMSGLLTASVTDVDLIRKLYSIWHQQFSDALEQL